jgi:hypothetical protein
MFEEQKASESQFEQKADRYLAQKKEFLMVAGIGQH